MRRAADAGVAGGVEACGAARGCGGVAVRIAAGGNPAVRRGAGMRRAAGVRVLPAGGTPAVRRGAAEVLR